VKETLSPPHAAARVDAGSATSSHGNPVPAELLARAARARHDLGALYPFEGRFVRGPRGWLHVVDEGPKDAPAVLFLHGNPSWSFLWREPIRALAATHRVLALDHAGCGLSGPLPKGPYTLVERIEDAQAVLTELGIQDVALVGHDWGGAIALGLARRDPARVRALSLSNTAGFAGIALPPSIRLCRAPLIGRLLLEPLNAFLGVAVRRCTHQPLSRAVRDGYRWPHREADRRASIRAFVEDIPLHPTHPSWPELAAIEAALPTLDQRPVMLLWGERDWCFHPGFRRAFEARMPRAQVVTLDNAGHWWPEDEPAKGCSALTNFLRKVTP